MSDLFEELDKRDDGYRIETAFKGSASCVFSGLYSYIKGIDGMEGSKPYLVSQIRTGYENKLRADYLLEYDGNDTFFLLPLCVASKEAIIEIVGKNARTAERYKPQRYMQGNESYDCKR
jgi:hypothetical protein